MPEPRPAGIAFAGFLRTLLQRSLLLPPPGVDSVAFWRRQVLELILWSGVALGFAAYVPSVLLSIRVHLWSVVVADTLAVGWVLWAALSPHWAYRTRVRGLLALVYGLSVVLLVRIGTAGSGLIWIAAFPVIAALLLGLRSALYCWLLALATLFACGWVMSREAFEVLALTVPHALGLAAWIVNSANTLCISALIALPTAILLRGLEHTQRALSREEERFTKIFQLSPEPIGITRVSDDRFLDVNAAWSRVLGWEREEVLGRTTQELGLWNTGADRAKLRIELQATGALAAQALDLCRKDGSAVHVLLSAKALDLEGEAVLLVMAQDLTARQEAETERRRLEAELLHAQKLESMGRLAGGVAHDMNNILAAIISMGSTLQIKYEDDAALVKALDIILSASERGRKLVRGLTDFARKGLEDPCALDLNALVREEVEILRSTTLRKIEIALDLAPGLPLVLGEPSALNNALMNLSVNAIDAMPEGGVLTFGTGVSLSGQVEMTVADTGKGMAPSVLARAMEPFFTTKIAGKGTGLGLPGVYGTMKAHGGTVEIQSEEGRGTRVLLRFPLHHPAAQAPQEPAAAPEAEPLPMRILLVDDDPMIQESLPPLLELLGNTVVRATRGQEALELLEKGLDVDLVVLDHNMPGLTGADTLVRLKALRPALPVILSTGFLETRVEELARTIPGVWLLNKPYSLPGMRSKMREIQGS